MSAQNGAYFNGYNTEKPSSSRVLKEPGGGSSDIFGRAAPTNGTHGTNGSSNGHDNHAAAAPAAAAPSLQQQSSPPKSDIPQHILIRQEALANKMKNSSASNDSPRDVRGAGTARPKDTLTTAITAAPPVPAASQPPAEEAPKPAVEQHHAPAAPAAPPKEEAHPAQSPPEPTKEEPKKEAIPEPVTPKKEQPAPTKEVSPPKPKRTGYNPITGESYEDEDNNRTKTYQQNDKQREIKNQAMASPTGHLAAGLITRKDETSQQKVPQQQPPPSNGSNNVNSSSAGHTSSRVVQPPGGRSTKLW